MSDSVLQIKSILDNRHEMAVHISQCWQTWHNQQADKRAECAELMKYLFATDTTTTSNSSLPWKNKTTMPKLTQLRDNLHSNYMSSIFPNDDWLTWLAYTEDAAKDSVSRLMTNYMDNKLREGGFRTVASRLVYDWLDTGNCYAMPRYERRYSEKFGEKVADFVGPKAIRISPYDIAFDVTASDFKYTPKIIRSMKKLGDIAKQDTLGPEYAFWNDYLEQRAEMASTMSGMKADDWEKIDQFSVDGFGSMQEYFGSHYVEVLEFYGDLYNIEKNELQQNRLITVVDRSWVVQNIDVPTYDGSTPIFHVGWRLRPDNLVAMGPLDNLVGLQYRLDHMENLKADAMDLVVHPPLKIIGEVEEFEWGPGVPIHIDENGDVQELTSNVTSFAVANNDMQLIEDRMELYAGAPREAMGIRTPGEKTAFEIDSLQTAAGAIRQEKVNLWETNFLEPLLNAMLEDAHRNFADVEKVKSTDPDTGVQEFLDLTKEDFTAHGILRPVGARHFAQQTQDLSNINQLFAGPLGQLMAPHTSSLELTRLVDNVMNLRGYKLFRPNVQVLEQQETKRTMNAAQEDLEVEAEIPTDVLEEPEFAPDEVEEGEEGEPLPEEGMPTQ